MVIMLSNYALGRYADLTDNLFAAAEIEINGTIKPMEIAKKRTGNKVRVLIKVPAVETGMITRRIVKDINHEIIWDDSLSGKPYALAKTEQREISLEIPISTIWKGGA